MCVSVSVCFVHVYSCVFMPLVFRRVCMRSMLLFHCNVKRFESLKALVNYLSRGSGASKPPNKVTQNLLQFLFMLALLSTKLMFVTPFM